MPFSTVGGSPAEIWTYATRVLSNYSGVWAVATRTLSDYAGVWAYATRLLTDYKLSEYTERSSVAAGSYVTYQPAAGRKGLVTWAYNPATTGMSECLFDGTNYDTVSVFSSAAGRCSTAIGTVALNSRYAQLRNASGSAQLYALTVLMFG